MAALPHRAERWGPTRDPKLEACEWYFEGPVEEERRTWPGWTDGTRWNGWANVYVTKAVFDTLTRATMRPALEEDPEALASWNGILDEGFTDESLDEPVYSLNGYCILLKDDFADAP